MSLRCLDADLGTITTLVTKVQLWDCNGQPHQGWATVYTAAPAHPPSP